MTIERMIELLNIEHQCVLRNTNDNCNRDCGACDLVQDDADLDEMYTEAVSILEAQKPRVMPLEAVLQEDIPFWFEYRDPKEWELNEWVLLFDTDSVAGERIGLRGRLSCHLPWTKDYGTEWRCWNTKPSDVQREAIPWP